MRKLTDFIFFKNTPLVDFQNTILFNNNTERDNFFLNGNHYESIVHHNILFNYIRDRLSIKVSTSYEHFAGVNYCTFKSEFEDTRFYCYVIDYKYHNDEVVEVDLLIDGIMTYCQGNVINNFTNLTVTRKHMNINEYNLRIDELKNNDDVIKTFSKKYTHNDELMFNNYDVLIQCSCSLTADFGEVNAPIVETSEGTTFDKISSPVNLYVVKQDKFTELMEELSPYAWISQNIRSVSLLPSSLLQGKTFKVTMQSTSFDDLYKVINNGTTDFNQFENDLLEISKTVNQLYSIFGLDNRDERHLLRNEYTTTEIYTWNGQQLFIDNGQLSDEYGLLFRGKVVSGFYSEIAVYVDNYKSNDNVEGSFLNDAIYIRDFDDIPILIDNYNLSLAKSAHQRQVTESRLVTNRLKNIGSSNADIQDRFYDAASLVTNFSPFNLFGKFVNEHEFYQNQQAEFKDMALQTPTITSQSFNNALAISNNFFGLTVKHAQPSVKEWEKVKKYYKMFGYEVNDENSEINIRTQTICDYAQFKGNFMIDNADISIVEMLKAQFENGVRFWHNNNTSNPMGQDVLNNVMR